MKHFAISLSILSIACLLPGQANASNDEKQAIKDCKVLIATFLGDQSISSSIPEVKNHGSENEFLFGWPEGSFSIGKFRGETGKSASCSGSFAKGAPKVEYVTINGKSVL